MRLTPDEREQLKALFAKATGLSLRDPPDVNSGSHWIVEFYAATNGAVKQIAADGNRKDVPKRPWH